MEHKPLILLAVGDIILETQPPADWLFDLTAPVLKSGDLVVGQGEVLFTSRGIKTFVEMHAPATPCDPRNINALASAGFHVITLAGNHVWDSGTPGIEDTINGLNKLGIATVGAGMNIDEARRPAIIERNGTRFGFLNYNCIGPRGTWATPVKPGCAYLQIITHYELEVNNPSGPPVVYSFAEATSLAAMENDIHKLRPLCDVLIVSFHKGVLMLATKIAEYDRQVAYTAIDAGADMVIGQHAHILQGIEQYKGKVIFHGIGNFVMYTESFAKPGPEGTRVSRLGSPMGWWADTLSTVPEGPTPPIPQGDSRMTLVAKCIVANKKIAKVSYLPCLINEKGQPEILKHDERGQQVFNFMEKITQLAGLNAHYIWEENEIIIKATG